MANWRERDVIDNLYARDRPPRYPDTLFALVNLAVVKPALFVPVPACGSLNRYSAIAIFLNRSIANCGPICIGMFCRWTR
jgi:hypothetical protein